ncbi:MAG: hypothetical protein NZ700_11600 [Gemmataceae bacterium]|nr:hypothetical protein [Gemmataceae bacterium]MDW8265604.1 hypothetical protein [Gemmataceae bacterium]
MNATRPRIDPDTINRLETIVQGRLSAQVRDFRLEVGDRGLILRGSARTYYAKQLAQHAVMQTCEFPVESNEIEVV